MHNIVDCEGTGEEGVVVGGGGVVEAPQIAAIIVQFKNTMLMHERVMLNFHIGIFETLILQKGNPILCAPLFSVPFTFPVF